MVSYRGVIYNVESRIMWVVTTHLDRGISDVMSERYEVEDKNRKPWKYYSSFRMFDMSPRLDMLRDHNSAVEERACLLGHTPAMSKVPKRYDHSAKAEEITAKLDRWDKERNNFEVLKTSPME
jgi:hypothetical protein